MLRSVGWDCLLPDAGLRDALRSLGCDTVLGVDDLVRSGSYDEPLEKLRPAGVRDMDADDVVYVDVKAHRNGPKVWRRWPRLESRTLWYRINGSAPEHVVNQYGDMGDEVHPPCPVLTPNRWYADPESWTCWVGDADRFYSFWPPFVRWDDYQRSREKNRRYSPPLCLVHNVAGWGYGPLVGPLRELGVRIHGQSEPDGLLPHREVAARLTSALCYVHLKSSDAPGYAIYEAMAAGCPVVVPRRLIWRSRMGELLEAGITCLVFDRETHDPFSQDDVESCTIEVQAHMKFLADPEVNRLFGEAGRERLRNVMWSLQREADVTSLREFLTRHFGE